MTDVSDHRVSRMFRLKHGLSSTDQISQYSEESEPQPSTYQRSPPRRTGSLRLFRKSSGLSTNGDRSSKIISNIFNRSKSSVERESMYLQPNDSKTWVTGFQLNTPFIQPQLPVTLESFADSDDETSDDEVDINSILLDVKTTNYISLFQESFDDGNYTTIYKTTSKISGDPLLHTLSSIEERSQSKPQLSIDTTLQKQPQQVPDMESYSMGMSAPSSNFYSISPQTFDSQDNYPEPSIRLEDKDLSPCEETTREYFKMKQLPSPHRAENIDKLKNSKVIPEVAQYKPQFASPPVPSCTSVSYSDKTVISDPISKSATFERSTPDSSQEDITLKKKENHDLKSSSIMLVAKEISDERQSKSKIIKWFSKVLKTKQSKGHTAIIAH
ncbi:uncharacterized protein SPAPADRAFT_58533 [Spathaspora passalidarum NRRL Y-27907]|uniref:Uncharacterized protein n=1 Tax=Spathaspora passalidarum (strain NRRL Y-27907 / 11-Y1) TaxID=619300 RepID=G3AGH2_SPAPN|nr:uncharacterized protein SPAPADRAFT_58533 [Spathaspora passalidarum NRRL Y-27907]EGW35311.1 hypothetical protein SPAPADRAFT_58533 [Spathaspora passalidarum NRRL Y-27907]